MTTGQQERIKEIDKRIKDINDHQLMWIKAKADNKCNQALKEIQDLTIEKNDILNGTNEFEKIKITREIEKLQELKRKALFFKKRIYKKQILEKEEELKKITR